ASGSNDNSIIIWDLRTGQKVRDLKGHGGDVYALVFTRDSSRLVSGSEDKTVRIWSMSTEECRILNGHTHAISDLAVTVDGKTLLPASQEEAFRMGALESGELKSTINLGTPVWCVDCSDDGKYFATAAEDKVITIWDAANQSKLGAMRGHT